MTDSFSEGPVPVESALDRRIVATAWFSDSYHAELKDPARTVTDLFEALLGHHPRWARVLLLVRNRIAAIAGLEVPPAASIQQFERKPVYAVGETIGPWPIFVLTENELIAGRDNRHLDFRFSVLKLDAASSTVAFSTICNVHNRFGKVYLFFVVPFHRFGMRQLLRRAVATGRL